MPTNYPSCKRPECNPTPCGQPDCNCFCPCKCTNKVTRCNTCQTKPVAAFSPSQCNCEKPCSPCGDQSKNCPVRLLSDCVFMSDSGDTLTQVISEINQDILTINQQIEAGQQSDSSIQNVGNGTPIYKGQTVIGTHQFKTIVSSDSVEVVPSEDTITLNVSEAWITNRVLTVINSFDFGPIIETYLTNNPDFLCELIANCEDTTTDPPCDLVLKISKENKDCDTLGSAEVAPIGGTAPYQFAWTDSPVTTGTRTGLEPGQYGILVTDANGCTARNTVHIIDVCEPEN